MRASTRNPIIIGHRGAKGYFTENSIEGFISCLNKNIRNIELDVVVGADNTLWVHHDLYLKTKNKEKKIIYRLKKKKITTIPELADVISNCNKHTVKPFYWIEIKSEKKYDNRLHPEPLVYAKIIYSFLMKHFKTPNNYCIKGFDHRILSELHKLSNKKKIKLVPLTSKKVKPEKLLRELTFKPFAISIHFSKIDKTIVSLLNKQKIKTVIWTVNNKKLFNQYKNMGVYGIITDYPYSTHNTLGIC